MESVYRGRLETNDQIGILAFLKYDGRAFGATALEDITCKMERPEISHTSVMVDEVLDMLHIKPNGVYVDGTVGLGGHSEAILGKIQPGGFLVGVDRDKESLAKAGERLKSFSDRFRLIHDNYKNLPLSLNRLAIGSVDGILLDMGVSSWQLLADERGFSFQSDAALDMRMDRTQYWTAADIVNETPESELADIIYQYGEERFSRRIAAAIVKEREIAPITGCAQLAGIISRVVPARGRQRIHPATKTFQALRIAANNELDGFEEFLMDITGFLKPGGRLAVSAFHSLEDRIVKRAFRRLAGQCVCDAPTELCRCDRRVSGKILTSRPITPGPEELAANPRARSARLRVMEKI
jgi:16S rRNA (cytosine1402-N4)-methyltransferase